MVSFCCWQCDNKKCCPTQRLMSVIFITLCQSSSENYLQQSWQERSNAMFYVFVSNWKFKMATNKWHSFHIRPYRKMKLEAQWFHFEKTLYRTFHRCFPRYFLIGHSQTRPVYHGHGNFVQTTRFQRRRFLRNWPTRNKNCLWWPCLLTDQEEMSNLYRGPSRDASYQVLDHLATRLQRTFFRNWPTRKKNCLWWPCLLTDRNKISNLNIGPSIVLDASYQVSVHLAKQFQRRICFRNRPIRNKNCLWWPCLLTDWNEMHILKRGPSIDAPYQVSVYLAKRFQRRIFFRNWPNEKQELPMAAVC